MHSSFNLGNDSRVTQKRSDGKSFSCAQNGYLHRVSITEDVEAHSSDVYKSVKKEELYFTEESGVVSFETSLHSASLSIKNEPSNVDINHLKKECHDVVESQSGLANLFDGLSDDENIEGFCIDQKPSKYQLELEREKEEKSKLEPVDEDYNNDMTLERNIVFELDIKISILEKNVQRARAARKLKQLRGKLIPILKAAVNENNISESWLKQEFFNRYINEEDQKILFRSMMELTTQISNTHRRRAYNTEEISQRLITMMIKDQLKVDEKDMRPKTIKSNKDLLSSQDSSFCHGERKILSINDTSLFSSKSKVKVDCSDQDAEIVVESKSNDDANFDNGIALDEGVFYEDIGFEKLMDESDEFERRRELRRQLGYSENFGSFSDDPIHAKRKRRIGTRKTRAKKHQTTSYTRKQREEARYVEKSEADESSEYEYYECVESYNEVPLVPVSTFFDPNRKPSSSILKKTVLNTRKAGKRSIRFAFDTNEYRGYITPQAAKSIERLTSNEFTVVDSEADISENVHPKQPVWTIPSSDSPCNVVSKFNPEESTRLKKQEIARMQDKLFSDLASTLMNSSRYARNWLLFDSLLKMVDARIFHCSAMRTEIAFPTMPDWFIQTLNDWYDRETKNHIYVSNVFISLGMDIKLYYAPPERNEDDVIFKFFQELRDWFKEKDNIKHGKKFTEFDRAVDIKIVNANPKRGEITRVSVQRSFWRVSYMPRFIIITIPEIGNFKNAFRDLNIAFRKFVNRNRDDFDLLDWALLCNENPDKAKTVEDRTKLLFHNMAKDYAFFYL